MIIDGSNVMHWDGGEPKLAVVKAVVDYLQQIGYAPGVVFDANAGYLLSGKYQHDGTLSRKLGLIGDRVMAVPKGTPADPAILQVARDFDAPIITNERFRDWADRFPEIRQKGKLLRGSFSAGTLALTIDLPAKGYEGDAAR